jgi:hypothetical protein
MSNFTEEAFAEIARLHRKVEALTKMLEVRDRMLAEKDIENANLRSAVLNSRLVLNQEKLAFIECRRHSEKDFAILLEERDHAEKMVREQRAEISRLNSELGGALWAAAHRDEFKF